MNFDDHEIWGAPVRASEGTPEPAGAETAPAEPGAPSAGRLYRSAGSEPHPEAILALPNHRRHTAVHPMAGTQWAAPTAPPTTEAPPTGTQAPITINSRIPRPGAVEDPAIAEVLGTPKAVSAVAGFTGWFKQADAPENAAAPAPVDAPAMPAADRLRAGALGAVAALPLTSLRAGGYTVLLTAVTTVVGVVEAVVRDGIGIGTGLALVLVTILGAWQVTPQSRWAAWVMPAYALIVAVIVAGQFGAGAPGASPVGQAMLVVTGLITLAPWLAVATVIGAAVPALRGRRG